MKMEGEILTQLTQLGLNQLEALVYANLLTQGPGTGYAIGQRIGKQTANVYKAVEALAEIGAVVVEDGERNRLVKPLPAERFLANLEARFQAQKEEARQALQRLSPIKNKTDDRVYVYQSAAAVINQAKAMLRSCQKIAVLDAFPLALEALSADLVAIAAQGKRVVVLAYQPIDLPGCHVEIVDTGDATMAQLFEGQQLNLVIDSLETMLSLLSLDLKTVRQAVWSKSVYLSFIMHVGLLRQHDVHQILNRPESDFSYAAIQEIVKIEERFSPVEIPGIRELMSGLDLTNLK